MRCDYFDMNSGHRLVGPSRLTTLKTVVTAEHSKAYLVSSPRLFGISHARLRPEANYEPRVFHYN
jgi:hypothetical protein